MKRSPCIYFTGFSRKINFIKVFWIFTVKKFKWDNLVTLRDDLLVLIGDGCLWVFKHEDQTIFGGNVDDWWLDGLRISSFTCGILAALWVRLQVAMECGLRTTLHRTLLALTLLETLETLWVGLVIFNFRGISILISIRFSIWYRIMNIRLTNGKNVFFRTFSYAHTWFSWFSKLFQWTVHR